MKNKKRLILICDKNPCTSFGRLTLDLKKALVLHYDVKIIWLITPQYFSQRPEANKEDEFITASSLYTGFFTFKNSLSPMVHSFDPDFVVLIRPELAFLVPSVKKINSSSKVLVFVHDTFAETLYPNSLKFKLINQFFIKNTVNADAYIFNSIYTQNEAQKHFKISHKPFCVLGCPVNFDLFKRPEKAPTLGEKKSFREKNKMVGYNGFCLNISLDEPRKNLETFFELARLCPETAFVRIGKITERIEKIIQKKQIKNAFHFTEITSDLLRDFYCHTDLVVYPSWLEGFGLPPLEALACGTPVASSATSALKENLEGITPLVFPPDDVESYVAILKQRLAGDPLVDWDKANALLDRFSLKNISERLIKFLQILV